MSEQIESLKKLWEPFSANEVNQLPKPYNRDSPKGNCRECGGYHGLPAAHLDYVGHAALTKRLLEVDPTWNWEPLAFDENGLPRLDEMNGLWIKLTVCGMTRLGYGSADGKSGPNALKETIGDALRNAGMRFGAALDLWHKGDLWDVAEAKGLDENGVVIGSGEPKTKKPETASRQEVTFPNDVVFAASSAFDNIEAIESDVELEAWYKSEKVKPLWDVPVDAKGTTIKSATKIRLQQLRQGASNV